MRFFLLFFTCALVVGIVLIVVMNAPTPVNTSIDVVRISGSDQPNTLLQSDPAAEHVLEFFPDPAKIIMLPHETDHQASVVEPKPKRTLPKASQEEMDRNRLLAMIEDWIYVDFSQVMSKKVGRIQRTREKNYMDVYEGKVLENEITVVTLTDDAATLKLGEAKFKLRLVQKPAFYEEFEKTGRWRAITPEEQKSAYEYYQRRFGDKFKAFSVNYKPPAGMKMPVPVTKEQNEAARQQYMEQYGNQFKQELKEYSPSFYGTDEQKQNFEKYWKKYHPGLPMPDFEQSMNTDGQLGPANRIQDDN